MKLSFNWLKDYVDLTGIEPAEMARRLTMAGLEVEAIEEIGQALEPVRVGHILSIAPHPQADKLVLCQVDFGGEPVQIVCGAANMREGDRVPVIPAGQRLPSGTKISKGKIRGEVSHGMLCSASELELDGDASGILILRPDAPVGASLADVLGLKDTVIELSVTPNRGDCLSMLGVAREVAALFGRRRFFPGALSGVDPLSSGTAGPIGELARVEIEDPDGCPRYAASVVLDVTVGPSPDWMARRLTAVGLRPINNLVDVTNTIMLETGQPLHVFDLDLIRSGPGDLCRVLVRNARPGEEMESIDHVVRKLEPEDCLITDGRQPIAIAGVMGGVQSEVTGRTRNILIECAHFKPQRIRRSAKRLGMSSEASFRFERTVDIEGVERAMQRAVELVLLTNAPGAQPPRVARGMADVYPVHWQPVTVPLRIERANALLGTRYTGEEMARALSSIDIAVSDSGGEALNAIPPSFRPDLEREVDLIEEVGRLLGLEHIPSRLPSGELGFEHRPRSGGQRQTLVPPRRLAQVEHVRDRLAASGLLECINYSFTSPEDIRKMRFGEDDRRDRPVGLANPLSDLWSVLRTSLLPCLLANVRHNLGHRELSIALYEMGPVFFEDRKAGPTGVSETQMVAGVLCGHRRSQHPGGDLPFDVFDLKGILGDLLVGFSRDVSFTHHQGRVPFLHPGVGAELSVGGQPLGVLGQIHPMVAEAFDITLPVHAFELNLERLLELGERQPSYRAFSRFPSATRDLALVVDRERPFGEIERALVDFDNPLIESFAVTSIYEGEPIPPEKKCVAVAITYRSTAGSLTDEKIDGVHSRLAQFICQKASAELR